MTDAGLKTRPTHWAIYREGGYVKAAAPDAQPVVFATIELLAPAGTYMVVFPDDRVLSACMRLGFWDGYSTKGPVFTSRTEALDVALKSTQLALELAWAKQESEEQVLARHGAS